MGIVKDMINDYIHKVKIELVVEDEIIENIIYCNPTELMIMSKFMKGTITEFLMMLEYIINDSLFSTKLHEIEDKFYHNSMSFEENGKEKIIRIDYGK